MAQLIKTLTSQADWQAAIVQYQTDLVTVAGDALISAPAAGRHAILTNIVNMGGKPLSKGTFERDVTLQNEIISQKIGYARDAWFQRLTSKADWEGYSQTKENIDTATTPGDVVLAANPVPTVIDNMEWATDGAAQAAYVSSNPLLHILDQQQAVQDTNNAVWFNNTSDKEVAQGFEPGSTGLLTKVDCYIGKSNLPAGTVWIEIWDHNGITNKPNAIIPNGGSTPIPCAAVPAGPGWITFWLPVPPTVIIGGQYYIKMDASYAPSTTTHIYWRKSKIGGDVYGGTYDWVWRNGVGGWNYTGGRNNEDFAFKTYRQGLGLECYSEAVEKVQGSYSLRVVASESTAGDRLDRDLGGGGTLNWSGWAILELKIKAGRAGANMRFWFGEAAYNENSYDIYVEAEDAWQSIFIDISDVADANKNAVRYLSFEILDASVQTVYYLDAFTHPGYGFQRNTIDAGAITENDLTLSVRDNIPANTSLIYVAAGSVNGTDYGPTRALTITEDSGPVLATQKYRYWRIGCIHNTTAWPTVATQYELTADWFTPLVDLSLNSLTVLPYEYLKVQVRLETNTATSPALHAYTFTFTNSYELYIKLARYTLSSKGMNLNLSLANADPEPVDPVVALQRGQTEIKNLQEVNRRTLAKSGAGGPGAVVPDFIGQIYVDTIGPTPYAAHGFAVGNWTAI